ncbi:phosphatidylglycerol lysyltransferase domain-containing protein [Oscillatoria sp. FACHB-1406]|uniref:phosphatidylglycerol lysyltransferase domain-containing protein n=1 Tax=Oscillatoria sp. FACHB-1406 TaxID=2692846 RepID=UPI001687F441|nr:phosphatidylglycerol lysyltransferase domain-containing protein [Oscillatoria sp. FACHB-1406]MBD2580395.1 bifunctional lysylphosphatidylglycerol flippase/synthetase MprF [Oscillatoria sp. FACHB-1406]
MRQKQRTAIGIWSAAGLTALVGVVNLISAATPSFPSRVKWLEEIFPFEVRAGAHIFAALSGFFLLALATNLLRRKRVAWILAIALLIISIASHLLKGLDIEESLLASVLLLQLLAMRHSFTARSDPPSIAQGARVFLGALLFTLAYGTIGFYWHDRSHRLNFNLFDAFFKTLAMFSFDDNAGVQPRTRFGHFFVNSIYTVGAVTFISALYFLLRPVLLRGEPATPTERQQAKALVERYGRSALARFALLEDKAYYFSPSVQSVIAYVPKGRGAIALGDPIGPLEDRMEAILGFQGFCQRNDWYPAFYQTQPDYLELYRNAGFKAIKIGEEAIVDLDTFTLKGKAAQNLRTAVNRCTKVGDRIQFYQPPLSNSLIQVLRSISDEWLQQVQGAEKKFSLGWFEEDYLRSCEVATVEKATGEIVAFANLIPEYQLNEVAIDLMRHRTGIESGTMDFLFISMFQHFQERGYSSLNLGLSALAGVGGTDEASKLEKGLNYLYEHLNRFYNFKGLHSYKGKFRPRWESRYFVYPGTVALPDVVVALVRADSGDRLLDYFKPGS